MEYLSKGIVEIHGLLKSGEITSDELVKESLKKSSEVGDKCNAFVTIIDSAKGTDISENLLSGVPYGAKDNYATSGVLTTGSSNSLKNFVPFYTATAIEKLEKSGAILVNKTVMDEFGMGGTGTTGHTGVVRNPWDLTRMCAGSSAGSAAAVSSGVYPYALGTDTGDSIRKPAAYCGIVGYKPTYGMISRFGVYAFASSMDHLGVLTRSVEDAAIVVDAMKGIDKKDMTSWDSSKINLYESLTGNAKGKKLCYIREICDIKEYDNPTDELILHLENFHIALEKAKSLGMEVEEVTIDKRVLNAIGSVYDTISCAEATSNLANLTGIIFGERGSGDNYIDNMKNYRTENFSSLIKRRLTIGSYVLQAENKEKYFFNAQRARRVIVNTWKDLYKKYDAIILPVAPGVAPKLEDTKVNRDVAILEHHLKVANFGGFPSITIPDGFIDNLPVGLSITGDCYEDGNVLNIAHALEASMTYKGQIAKEVK